MRDPTKKINILKGSLESGVIDESEYKNLKEKIVPDLEQFDKKVEEINKAIEPQEGKKSSEKALIISVAIIILLLASIVSVGLFNKTRPRTLEDLHVLNLQGKLKPSQGYVYKGVYSFITLDNLWFTQLTSPKGTKIYSLALRYSPKDLKDIAIEGRLDHEFFNNQSEFYVTFNPKGKGFSYVGLAAADFDTHMSRVFEKRPISACDRNETESCETRPIVNCDDADKLVLYLKEADRFRTYYNNNCIVIEGSGFDLVRGVDRILYNLYNIMKQEEV